VPQLPFSAYYGLLSRSPTRTSPALEEAIAQGEDLPASVEPAPR
jgi:circadian clock protein KaiC